KYLEAGAYTKKQLFTYDKYRDAILTERSVLSDAERTGMEKGIRQGIEQGMEKGIKKGIEQGMEQGIRKGIEQGMEKGLEKVAAACLKKGMSLEDVTELTGLTADEIRKLQ
ncbi:MAG: hypothetical protein LBG96_13420, partial [Tannerella sp.]|nr:hypothetical protein [Tannerella sp.]